MIGILQYFTSLTGPAVEDTDLPEKKVDSVPGEKGWTTGKMRSVSSIRGDRILETKSIYAKESRRAYAP